MTKPGPLSASVTRCVEWVDTDASGHQHNGLIMRLVESAERQLMTQAGILDDYFWSAPRVRQEINFTGKLYFGQQVSATVTVEKLGPKSLVLAFEVWGEEFGPTPRRLAASGRIVSAHVPRGTERSAPWPPTITAALQPPEP